MTDQREEFLKVEIKAFRKVLASTDIELQSAYADLNTNSVYLGQRIDILKGILDQLNQKIESTRSQIDGTRFMNSRGEFE